MDESFWDRQLAIEEVAALLKLPITELKKKVLLASPINEFGILPLLAYKRGKMLFDGRKVQSLLLSEQPANTAVPPISLLELPDSLGPRTKPLPAYIVSAISPELADKLNRRRYGLKFNGPAYLQMQITRLNHEHGGITKTYRVADFDGYEGAIKQGIADYLAAYAVLPAPMHSKMCNVRFYIRFDKRKNKYEYLYRADYQVSDKNKECGRKNMIKTFSMGHKEPSPDKMFHAYRTAMYFRYKWEIDQDDMDFDLFKAWKTVRLYSPDREEFDWYEFTNDEFIN